MAYAGTSVDTSEKLRPPPSLGTSPETLTQSLGGAGAGRPRAWCVPERIAPMYAQQASLRRLPVPPLEQTCLMYLQTLRPLCAAGTDEWERSQRAVLAFLTSGAGERLQQRLLARAAAKNVDSSWLIDWWNGLSYFGFRETVVINVSYFYQFRPCSWSNMAQTTRAAGIAKAVLAHRRLVVAEQLPVEMAGKNVAADMSMYRFLYSACRVAAAGEDHYVTYEPALHGHAIVMRRGRLFRLALHHGSSSSSSSGGGGGGGGAALGEELSAAEIEAQLRRIVALGDAPAAHADAGAGAGIGPGVLTSDHRDAWTAARAHLLASGGTHNGAALAAVESAAFVLCLDEQAPATAEEKARAIWHSATGGNRWFDKPLQFIVAANGEAGFVGEHGMMDGQPTALLCDWVLGALADPKSPHRDFSAGAAARAAAAALPPPTELVFQLDARSRASVASSKAAFDALVAGHDCHVVEFGSFGKSAIKADAKVSPDAFCQMAIQLAYHRWSGGRRCATYESCSVRGFLHGRTETIRSCHSAGAAFVDAMAAPADGGGDKAGAYAKLKAAAAHQSWYSRRCADAMGCDRHLLGLKLLLEPGEEVPALFADPLYDRSKHWNLSTSTLASEYFATWGFGEVVADGFGVGYMCNKGSIAATVTSRHLGAKKFGLELEKALEDMRRLAVEASGSKL
jgi:carnitine O-acetyltransferase